MSTISELLRLISQGVHDIERVYVIESTSFPSLDEPWVPSVLDEKTKTAVDLVTAAAYQLISMIRDPHASVFEASQSMYFSAALGIVERANVAEILAAAGPAGLHVDEIGKISGMPAPKLARYLRLLATRNIFREVQPDVFTFNRLSSVLNTGKSVKKIQSDPIKKYESTNGVAALIGHTGDEVLLGASHMLEIMTSKAAFSYDAKDTAICKALGAETPIWEVLARPEHAMRLQRFGVAMRAVSKFGTIPQAPLWKELPAGSLIVDVGGGVGVATLDLARTRPDLRYIVQDRPEVVINAVQFWESEMPDALSSGRVQLQAHDFFSPQLVKNADIFFVRFICHDWSNSYVHIILKHLRTAAQASTKLVISDHIVPYGCRAKNQFAHIKGASFEEVPAPLLPNMGAVSSGVSLMDMQMLNALNGQERTVGEFVALGEATGWKLEEVMGATLGGMAQLIYVAV